MQYVIPNQLTYGQIGEEFCKCYYSKTINGINTIIDLFHPGALCTVEGEELVGGYNLLLKLANLGISRFEYNNVSGITQPISNSEIIVTVNGTLRGIGYWGQVNQWVKFNEVFILENIGGSRFIVKNYMIRAV